jgi:hypothetical protein
MIKKIVSGDQTGADQAALDAAIELGVQHRGWVPKGRPMESGPLPEKYKLQEMRTSSYPRRTEQYVIDSDGTLLFSHGKLTGGSLLTQKMTEKHGRPFLHVDFNYTSPFAAVKAISYWIERHGIEILNVAGPRLSKDPSIYEQVKSVIRSVLHLNVLETQALDPHGPVPLIPATVEEAVEHLVSKMPLRARAGLARMTGDDLTLTETSLEKYVRRAYGLWSSNKALMRSCRAVSGRKDLTVGDAATVVVKELWKKLRQTHAVKRVK